MLFLEVRDGTLPKDFEDTLRWRIATLFDDSPTTHQTWEQWQGYYTGAYQKYVDNLRLGDLAVVHAKRKHY